MTKRPALFKFDFLPDPQNAFVTEWPEMPREVFRSIEDARQAAHEFVGLWQAGGYDPIEHKWWARDQISPEAFRLTQFDIVVASTGVRE